MKNNIGISIFVVILIVVGVFVYSKKDKSGSVDLTTPLSSDFVSVRPAVTSLPFQELSTEEKSGLVFMREEEKLARDVYTTLYKKWNLSIFLNISQSEQTHTEAVQTLLVKYRIGDPVVDDSVGIFTNKDLGNLYTDLVKRGESSLEEALTVGAFIEDLDIADLQRFISNTDNEDIKLVYENLMRGSRNHLRSFASQIKSRGGSYEPKYITDQEFEEIVSSPRENGSGGAGRGWGNE